MKQINLLPESEQKEIELERLFNQLLKFWVWVIASLLVFAVLAFAARFYVRGVLDQANASIQQNQAVLNSSDYKVLQTQITNFNTAISQISSLRSQHYNWSEALIALANVTPSSAQLNHVTIQRTGGEVDISGQAQTRDDVIDLWSQVIKSSYFNNIDFPLSNLEKANVDNFNFTFYVNLDKIKDQ